jgi:hypothetical protein
MNSQFLAALKSGVTRLVSGRWARTFGHEWQDCGARRLKEKGLEGSPLSYLALPVVLQHLCSIQK